MINIKEISLKNFMSFGNNPQTFSFEKPGLNLIIGDNLDIPGAKNGSGKTSLLSGLVYALFGRSMDGLRDNDLINNINEKDMECSIIFEKGDNSYKIIRYRKTYEGNGVKLLRSKNKFIDTEEITLDSIANTNQKIIDIFGISYELFIRVSTFSANSIPFLSLSARGGSANQCSIIEELFELLELSDKSEILKDAIKENNLHLTLEENRLELLKAERARHETQLGLIVDRSNAWEETKLKNIQSYSKILEHIKDIDFTNEKLNHEIIKDNSNDLDITKVKLSSAKKDISVTTRNKETSNEELKFLKEATCPYCKQSHTDPDTIIDIEKSLVLMNDIIIKKEETISELITKKTVLEDKITSTMSELSYDSEATVDQLISQQQTVGAKISELDSTVNPFIGAISELSDSNISDISYNTVNNIVTDIEHQKFLYKLLTNKQSFIRKSLVNKHLLYLNSRLEYYLTELDLPHNITFGSDLSANISKFGRKLAFGNLSNGQRSRVNLALALAFRDIVERKIGPINVLILDEILDQGLDSSGAEAALKILKGKSNASNLNVFVISHREEFNSNFDTITTVQLKNNFSYLKY